MVNVVRVARGAVPVSKARWDHDHEIAKNPLQSPDRNAGDTVDGWRSKDRIVVGAILIAFLAIIFVTYFLSTPQQQNMPVSQVGEATIEPAQVPPPRTNGPVASSREPEWYESGTLHDATLADWIRADSRNQLATTADWAARMLRDKGRRIGSIDELLPPSYEIQNCLRAGTIKEPGAPAASWNRILRTTKAVEAAALCITMLESLPGSYFSKWKIDRIMKRSGSLPFSQVR
jgi:hypothetical protein